MSGGTGSRSWLTRVLLATLLATGGYLAGAAQPSRGDHVQTILYGDSLLGQAADMIHAEAAGRYSLLVRAMGGTALCDWVPTIEADLRIRHPLVIGLNFLGNDGTDCMRDASGTTIQKYRAAAATVLTEARRRHVSVLFLRSPVTEHGNGYPGWVDVYGPAVVDVGTSVAPGRHFTPTMPCQIWEGPDLGCSDGRIPVRSPDGTHLVVPGWHYQPGEVRYGSAISAAMEQGIVSRFGRRAPYPPWDI